MPKTSTLTGGWLQNLAQQLGFDSFRKLSFAMSKSRTWPKIALNPETIANKLRHADQRKDIQWWLGTGDRFFQPLADVLRMDRGELVERFQRSASSSDDPEAVFWTFKAFSELAPIDLRNEALFPGIPEEFTSEGGPSTARTWWSAPAGAGKTLVGRWLEIRHRWTRVSATHWSDIEFPAKGQLYVELSDPTGLTHADVRKIPKTLKICIAAPREPEILPPPQPSNLIREIQSSQLTDFTVLHTPAYVTWLQELLDWVEVRVKPSEKFDLSKIKQTLRAPEIEPLFRTPGELINFLGMLYTVGVDTFESATSSNELIVKTWLRLALDRPDHVLADEVNHLLHNEGTRLLVEAELARLRSGFHAELTPETWESLLLGSPPRDREQRPKLTSKPRSGNAQLQALLPPDSKAIVRGFRDAGILEPTTSEHLALRPIWIANLVNGIALKALHETGPEGMGTLLLFPPTAMPALMMLIENACAEKFTDIEACAQLPSSPSAERLAALDGAFRAIGLAILAGVDVPLQLASRLWSHQMSYRAERFINWPPIPIVRVAQPASDRGITANGAWLVGAFAISYHLHHNNAELPVSVLNPWPLTQDTWETWPEKDRCFQLLTAVGTAFTPTENELRSPYYIAAYRLGGAVTERLGILRHRSSLLSIQGPYLLINQASDHPLKLLEHEQNHLLGLPFGLEALEDICPRESELADVLRWCWSQWTDDINTCPVFHWLRKLEDDNYPKAARRILELAPASWGSGNFYEAINQQKGIWASLPFALWNTWLSYWAQDGSRWTTLDPFFEIPEGIALRGLRDGRIDGHCHDVRQVLWGRMADSLLHLIDELSAAAPTSFSDRNNNLGLVGDLVYAAPESYYPTLLERARAWIASPADYPATSAWLTGWLMHVIQQRSPGWRDASSMLISKPAAPPSNR